MLLGVAQRLGVVSDAVLPLADGAANGLGVDFWALSSVVNLPPKGLEVVVDGVSSLVDRAAKGLGVDFWALSSVVNPPPKGLGVLPIRRVLPSNDLVLTTLFSFGDLTPKELGVLPDPVLLLLSDRGANGFGLGSDAVVLLVEGGEKGLGVTLDPVLSDGAAKGLGLEACVVLSMVSPAANGLASIGACTYAGGFSDLSPYSSARILVGILTSLPLFGGPANGLAEV